MAIISGNNSSITKKPKKWLKIDRYSKNIDENFMNIPPSQIMRIKSIIRFVLEADRAVLTGTSPFLFK